MKEEPRPVPVALDKILVFLLQHPGEYKTTYHIQGALFPGLTLGQVEQLTHQLKIFALCYGITDVKIDFSRLAENHFKLKATAQTKEFLHTRGGFTGLAARAGQPPLNGQKEIAPPAGTSTIQKKKWFFSTRWF